jgi:hypothetical protein
MQRRNNFQKKLFANEIMPQELTTHVPKIKEAATGWLPLKVSNPEY